MSKLFNNPDLALEDDQTGEAAPVEQPTDGTTEPVAAAHAAEPAAAPAVPPADAAAEAGKTIETEVAIYCRIGNAEGLTQADHKEEHEQLEGDFLAPQDDGRKRRCRARKIVTGEDVRYEFTIKVGLPAIGAGVEPVQEETTTITEAFYEAFRLVAKKRLVKTRYVFIGDSTELLKDSDQTNLPPVKYEVDVYKSVQGGTPNWVKVDVELDDLLKTLKERGVNESAKLTIKVTHLPFEPQDPFIASQANEEQKALLDELWDKHFNQPAIPPVDQG